MTAIRNGPKQTISVRGGLKLLGMVSELDTKCVPARTLGPKGKWIVRSHIGWRGERNILYEGVETPS